MANLELLYDSSEVIHYNNPKIPIYIVKSDLTPFPNKCASCHWHDDIEIMYILEGHISYSVNGEIIDLNRNDAIIVNSKQLHYGFSRDNTNCHYYCYVFKPEILCNNRFLYSNYIEPVVSVSNIPYFVLRDDNPAHSRLLSLLPEIYRSMNEKTRGFELQVLADLQVFWSYWYGLLPSDLNEMHDLADPNIIIQKSMVIYIQKHYQQKLTIMDIATAGNVSRTKCCQLFKKYYHTSPIEYLNQFRLESSASLLRDSDLPITEIALSCGFNSSSYYTESFVKEKGCTPSDYRKKIYRR